MTVLGFVVLVFSVIAHELAHGRTALALGDTTARDAGRLSWNPLVHVDPFGTVLLPLLLWLLHAPFWFAYAKPVPVEPANFRRPLRDMALVAAAGPLTNLLLALGFALLARVAPAGWPAEAAVFGVWLNLVLGLLNLLPIPPLDGGRVIAPLLPRSWLPFWASLERWGLAVVAVLVASGALGFLLRALVLPLAGALLGAQTR